MANKKIAEMEKKIQKLIADEYLNTETLIDSVEYLGDIGLMMNRINEQWNKTYKEQSLILSKW